MYKIVQSDGFTIISNDICSDEEKYYRMLNKVVAIHLTNIGQRSLVWKVQRKNYSEMIGKKYGRLTVLEYLGNKNGYAKVKVRCDCGTEKETYAQGLLDGTTKSCGCLQKELVKETGYQNRKYNQISGYSEDGTKVYIIPSNKSDVTFIVDSITWNYLDMFCWYYDTNDYMNSNFRVNGNSHQYNYHKLLLSCPENCVRDHIDRNRLNNTYENLRIVSYNGSIFNRGLNSNNVTGVTGVQYKEDNDLWIVAPQWSGLNDHGELTRYFRGKYAREEAIRYRKFLEEKYYDHFIYEIPTERLVMPNGILNPKFPYNNYESMPWQKIFDRERQLIEEGKIPIKVTEQ